jgi:hypothetical protein
MSLRKAFFIEKGVNIPFDRSLFLVEKEVKEIKKMLTKILKNTRPKKYTFSCCGPGNTS